MKSKSPIKLAVTFHGAARTTTGSQHLLEVDDKHILLDCGLFQGRRKDTYDRNLNFPFPPATLHSAVLSHAHIDHSGNFPNLVEQGFEGPIYATAATLDLCRLMLRDSAFIQERDAEWINRRDRKRGTNGHAKPLYTVDEAETAITRFHSIEYHRFQHLLREVRMAFYDAGHILGSAIMVFEFIRAGAPPARLAFTGDLGRAGLPVLRNPEIPHNLDWLIMEGTYGVRTHDDISEAKEELRDVITRVAARGGKVIVPSFSVERTQEIVYYLNELHNNQAIPPIPVYVDSPLATNVTEIFRLHTECFNDQTRALMRSDPDPFGFSRLTYTQNVEQSKALNAMRMPCVIISAAGMCEAGRIVHHLRNSLEDPKNCILFVGYQAAHTLGRKIVERVPVVNIWGDPFRVRAEVVTLNTFSGHADMHALHDYARQVHRNSPNLKKIFLVHGEEASLQTLGATLREHLDVNIVIPQLGERHLLN